MSSARFLFGSLGNYDNVVVVKDDTVGHHLLVQRKDKCATMDGHIRFGWRMYFIMKRKMKKIGYFFKKDAVLSVALLLAVISAFIVKPGFEYFSYIDYRVLVLLFSLMLVVGGFKSLGVFRILGEKLCRNVNSLRGLILVLICLCFFSSMLITNDVALITFVPFTISVFVMIACENKLIPVIVLETIAANLGSMLTPIGNPQNLLLFSAGEMTVGEFILHMLPVTMMSFFMILICILLLKNQSICIEMKEEAQGAIIKKKEFWIYVFLFLVCMGNVFHLYSYWIVGVIVACVVFAVNKKLFSEADYSLLLTFTGFFIFIGNMKQIDAINQWILDIITGNELMIGILASQVISNVPAAMLLSGFTNDFKELLYGVNIGGLGTLIASMASLISYRFYGKAYPERKQEYFKQFTVCNVILLVVLIVFTVILKMV